MKCWIVLFVAIVAMQYISVQGDGPTKLYVGNLGWHTTEDTLREAFQNYGQVLDAIVMRDRDTGRSRGYGFVTMSTSDEANSAIEAQNDQELDGRRVRVNLANPRG